MLTFIKDYLVPIFTIVINGILAYFINQLPSIRPGSEKGIIGLPDTLIFVFTAFCVAALCILTFAAQSRQNSIQSNTNLPSQSLKSSWIGGFVVFLLGIILYGLLQINIIPKQSSIQFTYISLILCGFGAIVPSFLLMQKWLQNILLLLSAGIGVFLSFHYFSNKNLNALFLSFAFTLISIILLAVRDFLVQVIRDIALFWENLQNQQATGASQLIINKLEDLISPFNGNYYKALEYKCRDDETQGLDNERTLELQKVFVQLKIAANSVSNTRQDIISQDVSKLSNITIWDFLAAKNDKGNSMYKKIVILGRPGSGKTTLLRYLTLIYAIKEEQKFNRKIPKLIPILFYLREIQDAIIQQNLSLEALINQQIEKLIINNQHLSPPSHWVKNKLRNNKFLIMLDGLDEVADKIQRQKVRAWIDRQMRDYPDTIFILTSRPNGYKELKSQTPVDELEVQPFNREQVTDFLQRWYLQTEIKSRAGQHDEGVKQAAKEQANNLINRIVNNPSLVAMATNPLLLKMIATVHRRGNVLPGKRVELYKDICQMLLEKRQIAKNIESILTASQKQSILQELALKLMEHQTKEFTLAEAEHFISRQLATLPQLNNTEEFIKHIRDDCALLIEKEIGIYEFAHLSFQEYLAAIEIKESNQEKFLISNINNTWWAETIRLYAAQVSNASNLVRAIVDMSSPSINTFLVVADYENEGWRIEQQVKQQLFEKLDAGLESNDSEIFKLAVEVKLAKRLNNFVGVDEDLEVDNSYITFAEYELFKREMKFESSRNQQFINFNKGVAKNIIDGITVKDANSFCYWLSFRDKSSDLSNKTIWYRLLTPKERTNYNISKDQKTSIRLARHKLSSRYNLLAEHLMRGEWKKSNEETLKIMLQLAGRESQSYLTLEDIENFPCKDLYIIDTLWVSASNGHFGFSVQKEIYYESSTDLRAFCKEVDWQSQGGYIYNLKGARKGHLPYGIPQWNIYTIKWEQQQRKFFSRVETCKL